MSDDANNAGDAAGGCLGCVFGLLLLGLPVVAVMGIALLWTYPSIARKNNVTASDMIVTMLRSSSDEKNPYGRFFVYGKLDAYEIRFHAIPSNKRISGVRVVPQADGTFQHILYQNKKQVEKQVSALQHFLVSPEDLARAKRELSLAYPLNDTAVRQQILRLGEMLFKHYWTHQIPRFLDGVNRGPNNGSPDEQLFCVWLFLRDQLADSKIDITNLKESVRQAFREPGEYEQAIAWAKHVYSRTWRVDLDETKLPTQTNHGVLPANDVTACLLLIRLVGLDAVTQKEKRDELLGAFPAAKRKEVERWGRQLLQQRRRDNELPPPGAEDIAAILSVVDRLTNKDPYSLRCLKAIDTSIRSDNDRLVISISVFMGIYPNDDVYLILYGVNPFSAGGGGGFTCMIILQIALLLGLYAYVDMFLGGVLLGLKDNPIFERHQARRSTTDWYGWLIRLGIPFLAYLAAQMTISAEARCTLTDNQLLIGVYAITFLGGRVVEVISKVVDMVIIRFGQDPDTTWLDEIIKIPFVCYVLLHFQNDYLSLLIFLLAGLAPALPVKLRAMLATLDTPRSEQHQTRRRVAPPLPRSVPQKPKNPFDFS